MSWLRRVLSGSRTPLPRSVEWIFAEDVVSSVTRDECGRLAELAAGGRVLELGSYWGRSTIAMASTAAIVHSIDPHNGGPPGEVDTLPRFLENLGRYGVRERVIVHVGVSTQIVPLFRANSFDLVFIDAAHQRPYVEQDLRLATACVRQGGALAFHDYGTSGAVGHSGNWEPFGVREVVDEFADRAGALVETIDSIAILLSPGRESSAVLRDEWLVAVGDVSRSSVASAG